MKKQANRPEPIVVRLTVNGRGLDIDVTANVWEPEDMGLIEDLITTARAAALVEQLSAKRDARHNKSECIQCGLQPDAPIHTGGHPTRCHAPVMRVVATPEKGGR